ncbi:MAG TPA: ABC transporter permease [Chthonomonadaceae bacterium]|nr:ABC transporter permease [Chthonomonadaceae bacterium]
MLDVIVFELRFRLRQPATYLFFTLLLVLGFLCYCTEAVRATSEESVKANAPTTVASLMSTFTVLGAIMVAGLMGTSVYRDFERRAHELYFTTPLRKADYVFGRFIGCYLVTLMVFAGLMIGMPLGAAMPWIDAARLLPVRMETYQIAFVLIVVPNVLLTGALFFMVGAFTRKLTTIYTTGLLLIVAWGLGVNSLDRIDNRTLAAMLDPFGVRAISETIRYWTAAERNDNPLALSGPLLWNRLLWTGVAVVVLAIGYWMFSLNAQPWSIAALLPRRSLPSEPRAPSAPAGEFIAFAPSLAYRPFATTVKLARFYFVQIVRSATFQVVLVAGMIAVCISAVNADQILVTPVYPVTRIMVTDIAQTFAVFTIVLITFYAGELTWRERVQRVDQLADTLPVSTAQVCLAKIAAVILLVAALNLALIAAGIGTQAFKGYYLFEPGLYFGYLYGAVLPEMACYALFAFFVHSAVNHKFASHVIVITTFVLTAFLPEIGVEHGMFHLMSVPEITLSDMNGFGPFLRPAAMYSIYWLAFGAMLTSLTIKMWTRGTEPPKGLRRPMARLGGLGRAATAVAAMIFLASGGVIAYNTLVLNPFRTKKGDLADHARYERVYKPRFAGVPQPHVVGLSIDMRLFPERLEYDVSGRCRLRNETASDVDRLIVNIDRDLTVRSLAASLPYHRDLSDRRAGIYTLKLDRALRPGDEMALDFVEAYDRRGFANGTQETSIANNGTFLSHFEPHFGYQREHEIDDGRERERHGLPARPLMPPLSDKTARDHSYIANDSDLIDYDATIRTAPDQIAVTPGALVREWMQDGRRCFHYRMSAPIRYFVSVVSARYRVYTDSWTAKDGRTVPISIYYHPGHEYDLARMANGAKMSLAYCSEQYSPYRFDRLRVVEFPDYAQFAQSFAGTIPYSEGIGFLARVQDRTATRDGDIDYPFYVTAHEVAHQWWAHQVIGADAEGSEMLSESLAEYTALMVTERAYGRERMRKFLRLDLDRYLSGRAEDEYGEKPLARAQHQQYIHYEKGALVWYGMREQLGEAAVNAVLAGFLRAYAHAQPPYPISEDLIARLRAAAPKSMQGAITDAFEKITTTGCQALSARKVKTATGWHVDFHTCIDKYHYDEKGNATPAPVDDWVEVGVFGKPRAGSAEPGKALSLARVHLNREWYDFAFDVTEEPASAGIDPNFKLIDRYPDQHMIPITPGAPQPRTWKTANR